MKDSIQGQFVDMENRDIYPAEIVLAEGKIKAVERLGSAPEVFLMPGFIDAHVHVESSMLVPSEFARLAVVHGTVATVSDPHEIANVCGMEGVRYMLDDGRKVNFKFCFGAPSCVPATPFETAGATITAGDIDRLLSEEDIGYLSEMMNWPGVIARNPEVMEKIAVAKKYGKPVDGHAPGLRGAMAEQYASAGISTDHECFTREEALDKLKLGMKVIIREGSAARNFEALAGLIDDYPDHIMFCSDDKHPDSLVEGHINTLVSLAVSRGNDLFKVLRAACVNPVRHYGMNVGQLKPGDPADFIVVRDLVDFGVLSTYINGARVADKGRSLIPRGKPAGINNFCAGKVAASGFRVRASGEYLRIIEAHDGELITSGALEKAKVCDGFAVPDTTRDILKIAVVNRYENAPPAVAFVRNFGIKEGAIASSVAHDCHNIIAVGSDDKLLARAVNLIVDSKGGISAVSGSEEMLLPLPVAGIMSDADGYEVARKYTAIEAMAKSMGSTLQSPFMTLSFMALLVIPDLKLSDRGLFSGKDFRFVPLFSRNVP
ncbi:adenine deaminase [Sinomicrobium soli]|uniref:adenine deaminase n=1 Tax=Sinomicrobium sp. N-1-3-6 TaxID=2219864 RepID=UPI000DCC9462|nr:adenine deaminase [Sinomicrobium sp. N-1-3-6]RAV28157.1 adenine deaminase [Sinomicrobium sp. N-1-3-6]